MKSKVLKERLLLTNCGDYFYIIMDKLSWSISGYSPTCYFRYLYALVFHKKEQLDLIPYIFWVYITFILSSIDC